MFPSLRYTRLDPGCSLRAIYMTNGCIIPGITQLVKSFFYKNGKMWRLLLSAKELISSDALIFYAETEAR